MDAVNIRIVKKYGTIELREFVEVINSRSDFRPIPDRQMINPFTNEPIAVPGTGKAYYLREGRPVGNLALEDGTIATTGIPRDVCDELATRLGAIVEDLDLT